MLRWLARQTGRLPWVLATHRLEDVPPSATHALLLGRGRIVYRGALRGAPLKRWLEYQPRKSPPASPRRAARPGGPTPARPRAPRAYPGGGPGPPGIGRKSARSGSRRDPVGA